MKNVLILFFALFLSACESLPPTQVEFPEIPESLKQSCPDLELVKENEQKLSEVLKVISNNYSKYHECRLKVDLWLQWYAEQRKIYRDVK